MKQPAAAFLIFFVAATVSLPVLAVSFRNKDPLGNTLELLRGLASKVQKEGDASDAVYEDYYEWCGKSTSNAHNEVTTTSRLLDKLKARVADLSSAIETADSSIEELASTITKCKAELKEAAGIRESEQSEFERSEASLLGAIAAFDRASSILERNLQKNKGASLAQLGNNSTRAILESLSAFVDAAGLPAQSRQQLLVLAQTGVGDMRMSDAAAQIYETESSGIMDILEDIKDKAAAQLSNLRKAEHTLKKEYALLKKSLDHKLEADTKDMDEQKMAKAAAEEGRAATEGDISVTEKEGKESAKDLEDIQKTCMQAAADHESSSKERREELKALRQAAKILAQHVEGALEQELPTSLVQLRASSKVLRARVTAAASLAVTVRRLAQQHHSATLARLASRIAAVVRYGRRVAADPFTKVKQLIQDLLEKLIKEGESEAQEKEYCDQEFRSANAKRKELEDGISTAKAAIEQATAKLAELQQEIRDLEAELAALADEQAAMDKNRRAAHEEFLSVTSNFKSGLAAVRGALEVLRDYYASKSDEESAMLQDDSDTAFHTVMQQPAFPQRFVAARGAGTTIINILELIESESSSNLEKAETEEADAQAAHDEMTKETELSSQQRAVDVKFKTRESQALAKQITEVSADRASSETELAAVIEYISKLESRCIAQPDAFDERMKRRLAEIQGLKDALEAIGG